MPGPIYMRFSNLSSYELKRDLYGASEQKGFSSLSKTPSATLAASGGTTEMEMDANFLTNFVGGQCSISCGWDVAPGVSTPWGVRITAPLQVFTAGDRPYYEIKSAEFRSWKKLGEPYESYEFEQKPLTIRITPTSGHTSLSLDIVITSVDLTRPRVDPQHWMQNAPQAGPWQVGNRFRYAVLFADAAGRFASGGDYNWSEWVGVNAYAFPTVVDIAKNPASYVAKRVLYRQFAGYGPIPIKTFTDNTTTTWIDKNTDFGPLAPEHAPIPPPHIDPGHWQQNAPQPGGPWQKGNRFRYAVLFVDAAGRFAYGGDYNWSEWIVVKEYAFPTVIDIAQDTEGVAAKRVLYRQFEGYGPLAVKTFTDNKTTTWADTDNNFGPLPPGSR